MRRLRDLGSQLPVKNRSRKKIRRQKKNDIGGELPFI